MSESSHPSVEQLVEPTGNGRVFTTCRLVSIDDADPAGRMELDAIGKFLQDAGNEDTDEAGLAELGLAWVARRMTVDVFVSPRSRETLDIATWCSGTGRYWAERRTTLRSDAGAHIEAGAIWIHIDGQTGAPTPWGENFANRYLEATGGRKVGSRLLLPKRPETTAVGPLPWRFRRTDTDAFNHVNNAAYLAVVEEFAGQLEHPYRLEIEWRAPTTCYEPVEVYRSTDSPTETFWMTVNNESRAVARLTPHN